MASIEQTSAGRVRCGRHCSRSRQVACTSNFLAGDGAEKHVRTAYGPNYKAPDGHQSQIRSSEPVSAEPQHPASRLTWARPGVQEHHVINAVRSEERRVGEEGRSRWSP